MKTILILLFLSLGYFATADQNPDSQGSAYLSDEQINYLTSLSEEQIKALRNITTLSDEQINYLTSHLSEEQIDLLKSLFAVNRKMAQAKGNAPKNTNYCFF